MIISDEQVERVLAYVRSGSCNGQDGECVIPEISPELAERIRFSMESLPDVRADRVEQARSHLEGGNLNADDVATKMIARVLSDSIR